MREVISLHGLYMLKKIKECDEQFYVNTLYSSRWNGKIFQRHRLPKLTQETTDNMNNPVSIKEIKSLVLQTLPQRFL